MTIKQKNQKSAKLALYTCDALGFSMHGPIGTTTTIERMAERSKTWQHQFREAAIANYQKAYESASFARTSGRVNNHGIY